MKDNIILKFDSDGYLTNSTYLLIYSDWMFKMLNIIFSKMHTETKGKDYN